ncbi:MAG: copper chaperone PCu(A)C [Chloroflexales bacterium]|nr:copper chaperone PCu(A)C [Chloroflexales bacterium]
MYKRFMLVGLAMSLMILSACGATESGAADGSTTEDGATESAITISEPWVRAAIRIDTAGGDMQHADNTDTITMTEGMTMTEDMESSSAMTMTEGMTMTEDMSHGNDMMAGGGTSAAYMTIVNNSSAPDAVVGVSTDVADVVELHTVEMDGDVMRMRPISQIDVPANGSVELKPGGLHIMLIGLKQELSAGDTINLTLMLQNTGEIQVEVPVRQS